MGIMLRRLLALFRVQVGCKGWALMVMQMGLAAVGLEWFPCLFADTWDSIEGVAAVITCRRSVCILKLIDCTMEEHVLLYALCYVYTNAVHLPIPARKHPLGYLAHADLHDLLLGKIVRAGRMML